MAAIKRTFIDNWIAQRVMALIGFEDEVVTGLVVNSLDQEVCYILMMCFRVILLVKRRRFTDFLLENPVAFWLAWRRYFDGRFCVISPLYRSWTLVIWY